MKGKLDKNTNCEYCGKDLEAKYRSKRFCDDKCRVYFNRENKPPKIEVKDLTAPTEEVKPKETPTTNYAVDTAPVFKNDVERMIWNERQKIINNKNK